MKIGILTFHRSQNYGALLQALGLQDFLRSKGHDVSFVDYWPAYHEEMYKPFSWRKFFKLSFLRKGWYALKFIFTFPRLSIRRKRTRAFIDKFLKVSSTKTYDMVIYGSDQIWRKQHQPTFDYFNPVYWGEDYVNTHQRVAYAASMGEIEIDTEKDRDFVIEHLKLFNSISIREIDLIERLKKEFGIEYKQVCDPVFLISKEHWLTYIDKKYIPSYKYILYYRLQAMTETDKMVEELVSKTGYKVIEMRSYMPFFHYGRRYRLTADAQEFISLIHGAEYVVTSAFHGIAMSIIFEKQFFFTSQKKQANRVASLLQTLGLESRFADGYQNVIDLNQVINYENVNNRLIPFVKESQEWLLEQLKK